jgi:hypothetical protein
MWSIHRQLSGVIEANTLRLSMVGVMNTTFYGFALSVKNEYQNEDNRS